MNRESPKVIYLFGKQTATAGAEAERPEEAGPTRRVAPRRDVEPRRRLMSDTYSTATVGKLLGIPEGRLRYWARSGLVEPTGRRGQTRYYTFQDLVGLRVAKGLLEAGVSARRVRRAVEALRRQLPRHSRPLVELRVYSDGDAVVVRDGDRPFDAESGQLLLDFSVRELEQHVVELSAPRHAAGETARRSAFDWYREGCRLEREPEALEEAEAAYLRAVELDPRLSCAYTNLGNLRYRSGAVEDARVLYEKALELEPDQPEAYYNLGYLAYEEGDVAEATRLFRRAVELEPGFADAHFNLAMAQAETGDSATARVHFLRYLELEPEGPWADVARRHLAGT